MGCTSFAKRNEKFFDEIKKDIEVHNIKGKTIEAATENAKYKILEIGLNKIIENLENSSGEFRYSREDLEPFSPDTFILDYLQLRQSRNLDGFFEIDAKARLELNRTQNEFLNPHRNHYNLVVNIEEEIDFPDTYDYSITKNSFLFNLNEFRYLDSEQFQKYLIQEGITKIKALSKIEEKNLEVASKFGAEILLLGKTKAKKKKTKEGDYWEISFHLKFLDVGKNEIITTIKTESLFPMNQQLDQIMESIIKAYRIPILRKINEYRLQQIIIILKINGINYHELLEKGDFNIIRTLKGINSIKHKPNLKKNNLVILEVESYSNGIALYQRLQRKRKELGFDFKQKIVKPELVEIEILK
ncbi:MAG: hypothetical protein KBA66_11815 [Leptospiraceae bacterium]|nr:hypothetical protein [Leptospiraceae bacterium]